jgi:histidinol dehydrogenase
MGRVAGPKKIRIVTADRLGRSFYERPGIEVSASIRRIVGEVRRGGDRALRRFAKRFDGVALQRLRVPEGDLRGAWRELAPADRAALRTARRNIERFARLQKRAIREMEFAHRGVRAGHRLLPIERIGLYVPGGRHPLVSTLLMGAVPARVAGVSEIAVCTPARRDGDGHGTVHPAVLAAAYLCGVKEVYRVGGAHAIAALAYGTRSIRRVDKIVGPGGDFVTQAKAAVVGAVGIDLLAGPTELLVLADGSARADWVAADLLAQAEHDPRSEVVLVTTLMRLAREVRSEIVKQAADLPESSAARRALRRAWIVKVRDRVEGTEVANRMAPEHLHLQVRRPRLWISGLRSYGALFVGAESAVPLGDYVAGPNHTLPTGGSARYRGGLSVSDFLKVCTTLEVKRAGLKRLIPAAVRLARLEGLSAHVGAIKIRQKRA